jgi:putative ABC transport system substrate-binding protein
VSDQSAELSGKRVELLKEVRPDATRIAVLWNGRNEAMTQRYREIERAASALHVSVQPMAVRDSSEFEEAFRTLSREKPDALLVVTDALTNANMARMLDFAAKAGMPAMYEFGPIVREGGLISYGPPPAYTWVTVASYVDRILKGAKPAEMPIEQPKEYELVLNLRTAKSLGISIPPSVFQRATDLVQ